MRFPRPPCSPPLPFPPPPVRPSGPGCTTKPGLEALEKLLRKNRNR